MVIVNINKNVVFDVIFLLKVFTIMLTNIKNFIILKKLIFFIFLNHYYYFFSIKMQFDLIYSYLIYQINLFSLNSSNLNLEFIKRMLLSLLYLKGFNY